MSTVYTLSACFSSQLAFFFSFYKDAHCPALSVRKIMLHSALSTKTVRTQGTALVTSLQYLTSFLGRKGATVNFESADNAVGTVEMAVRPTFLHAFVHWRGHRKSRRNSSQ